MNEMIEMIAIKIDADGGLTLDITVEQAKELYHDLDELFGENGMKDSALPFIPWQKLMMDNSDSIADMLNNQDNECDCDECSEPFDSALTDDEIKEATDYAEQLSSSTLTDLKDSQQEKKEIPEDDGSIF